MFNWLVVYHGIPTPLKNDGLRSVGMIIPNIWKVIKFHGSKAPSSQELPILVARIWDPKIKHRMLPKVSTARHSIWFIQTKGCKRCMCLFFSHLNAHPMPAKCPFSASSASTVASAASSPESAAGAVSAASRAWASAVAGASSLEASKGSFSWACWARSSCRTRWERLAHDLFHVPSAVIQWSMSWFQEQSSGWSPHTVPSLGKNRSCSHAKSTNYLWMELTWRQQTGSQLRHHHKWYLAQKAIWIVLEMEHGNTYHINVRSIFITIQKSEGKYEKIMEHMVSTVSFGSFP